MNYRIQEVESRLRSGEDSGWEFKQVEFAGDRPRRPTRDDWADEIAAFANAVGGVVLAGVSDDGLVIGMSRAQIALAEGGSVIFSEATGHLPGLKGRLNPIRDTHDRTYLYASNIAIDDGKQQPVQFIPGEELRLTDAEGTGLCVRIVDIVGRSALVEYSDAR